MLPKQNINLFCVMYGHNYVRVSDGKDESQSRIVCKTCGKLFCFNSTDNIVEKQKFKKAV